MKSAMYERDERHMRYRECLELEAHYGQFLPCEDYSSDPESGRSDDSIRPPLSAGGLVEALIGSIRVVRNLLRLP